MHIAGIVKLKEEEKVTRVVRNHWIAYAVPGGIAGLLILAPFFFMLPLFKAGWWGVGSFALAIAVGLLYAARTVFVWYWNCFVITSARVVDVDQRGFFHRTVSEATYDKIQDVSYAIKGVWGTLLNFGVIDLQTAGSSANLELTHVHDPKEIHHLITETMAQHRAELNGGTRKEKVAGLLEAAADLNNSEARAFLVALQGAVKEAKDDAGAADASKLDESEWRKRDI